MEVFASVPLSNKTDEACIRTPYRQSPYALAHRSISVFGDRAFKHKTVGNAKGNFGPAAGPSCCRGKGYNLGRLQRNAFPVPDDGVLPVEAYREVILDPAHFDWLRVGERIALPPHVIDTSHSRLLDQGLEEPSL